MKPYVFQKTFQVKNLNQFSKMDKLQKFAKMGKNCKKVKF